MGRRDSINKNKIIKLIEKYPIVSFDIFDTLLKRNTASPQDVFELAELFSSQKEFTINRVKAERIARENGLEEITFDEIYNCMEIMDRTKINDLKNLELKIEEEILTVNLDIKEIYDYCLENNKDIYIISDMYLPEEFLNHILGKNGYIGFKKLYVSSKYRKTKSSGTLYQFFLEETKLSPDSVIHIGDSLYSDYIVAKKCGLNAYNIPIKIQRDRKAFNNKDRSLESKLLSNFINNTIVKMENEYYRFGYDSFGPFLWGFVSWLYKNITKEGIKKVYFFSRDGLIMKRAFDVMYGFSGIKTYYLEVSRRSLRVPVLWMDSDFTTLLDMITPSKIVSLKSIFDGIGLEMDDFERLQKKYGFTKEEEFDRNSISQNLNLKKMYEELKPKIIENSKAEFQLLREYIKQNHIKGKFAVVDIGWSGGMQRFLSQILTNMDIEHDIFGYYTGVAAYYERNHKVVHDLKLKGYLFDFSHYSDIDVRSGFVGLYESLFLETDGSVKCYARDKEQNCIKAIRYPYEYLFNGEKLDEALKVDDIQNGAMDFINNIKKSWIFKQLSFGKEQLFHNLFYCGNKPSCGDLKMFSEFRFFDEGKIEKLASPKGVLFYIFHMKQFKSDFLNSRWKIGFMKRLFKIQLPYYKIYRFLLGFK